MTTEEQTVTNLLKLIVKDDKELLQAKLTDDRRCIT